MGILIFTLIHNDNENENPEFSGWNALAANTGFAQAADLDETAGMPEILGTMGESEVTVITGEEMENIYGEAWYLFGWKISNKSKTRA